MKRPSKLLIVLFTILICVTAGAAKKKALVKKYKVKKGDNLHRISQMFFGETNQWRAIAELNALKDPNLILIGKQLKLRALPPAKIVAEPVPEQAPTVAAEPAPVQKQAVEVVEKREVAEPAKSETTETGESSDAVERGAAGTASGPREDLISFGLMTGFEYLFPFFSFEHVFSPQITVGFMPVLYHNFSSTDPDTVLGGYATVSYSLGEHALDGPFLAGGLGAYSIKASSPGRTTQSTAGAVFVQGGFHEAISESLMVSGAGGFQYVSHAKDATLIAFGGFMPMLSVSLGYSF